MKKHDWNLAIERLKQISEITEDVRRHHYRARKHQDKDKTTVYKEMVWNLYFEINLYLINRDVSWSKYLENNEGLDQKEDIVAKFEQIDQDLKAKGKGSNYYLNLIKELETLDEIVNIARMDQGLDIPKGAEKPNPKTVGVDQKR